MQSKVGAGCKAVDFRSGVLFSVLLGCEVQSQRRWGSKFPRNQSPSDAAYKAAGRGTQGAGFLWQSTIIIMVLTRANTDYSLTISAVSLGNSSVLEQNLVVTNVNASNARLPGTTSTFTGGGGGDDQNLLMSSSIGQCMFRVFWFITMYFLRFQVRFL